MIYVFNSRARVETLTSMDKTVTVSLYGPREKGWGLNLLIEEEGNFQVVVPNSLTLNEWRDFIEGKGPRSYNNFRLSRKEGFVEYSRSLDAWGDLYRILFDIENELIMEPLSDVIREAVDQGFFGEEIRDAEQSFGVKGSEE